MWHEEDGVSTVNEAIASGGGRMEYRVLGPVEARRDGDAIALGRRAQMLLALLLIHANQVVSTDRIIDELWGDDPGRDPQNALWVVVSRLRGVLDPDREKRTDGSVLITQHPGYRLVVDDESVDARQFERLAFEGRRIRADDSERAAAVLGEALGLWRGHAFESFTYEPFAAAEIARLEALRLDAVEDRMEAEFALGRARDLVAPLEGLVREHPSRQRLVGQLMRALHLSERQGEALRLFKETKARLAEDQGLDPSPELVRLEEQILLDDPELRRHSGGPVTTVGGSALLVRGYELRERIESPTGGELYRAFQPAVGREVTIEIIGPELANDADFIRSFEVEAKAVAQLEHPQVVPVFDFWREPDAAYLVTRHFEHGTLRAALDARPLTVDEAAVILQQVGGAVEAASRRSASHGDLSADNIMLDADRNAFLGNSAALRSPNAASDAEQFIELRDFVLRHTVDGGGERLVLDEVLAHEGSVGELVDNAQHVLGRHDPTSGSTREVANPYQGLRAFGEDDSGRFHGRERLIERLVTRLGDNGPQGRFVALVGPSGSGKSSVVRAGVIPALRNGAARESERWFIVTMTPGRRPFESLAEAMLSIAVDPPTNLAERLRADGLSLVGERVSPDPAAQIVIVVDQFEELFTQSEQPDEFIDALVKAVSDRHSGIKVIATMRADFYDRPLERSELGELLRVGTEVITPMTPEELERAITRPARNEGVEFEAGAVARITADMAGQSAALPLLQHALTELFDARSGSMITTDSYAELGGVAGALARRADALYEGLDSGGQRATHDLFLRLVTVQDGSADTRRRAPLNELREAAGSSAEQILRVFGDHRLLSFDQDPSTRAPTAEIAHEALLTRWTALGDWIDGARTAVHSQRRLALGADEWLAADEAADLALTGSRLGNYAGWLDDPPVPLTALERRFLAVSEAVGEAELEAERQRSLRFRRLATVAAGAFVVAAFAAGLALWQQGRAAEAADVAEAQTVVAEEQAAIAQEQSTIARAAARTADVERMRAQAVAESRSNPPLAALLATEAFRLDESHLSAGAIQRVLTSVDGRQTTLADGLTDYGGPSVLSDDGSLLAAATSESLEVWDLDARTLQIRVPVQFPRFDMAEDGSLLATTSLGFEGVQLIDTATGDVAGSMPTQPCHSQSLSSDGSLLALITNGGSNFDCDIPTRRWVEIWDITDPSDAQLQHRSTRGNPWSVELSPNGEQYVTVDVEGAVTYWDLETHDLLWEHRFDMPDVATPGVIAEPTGTLFAGDGSRVVVGVNFSGASTGILLFSFDTETGALLAEPTSTGGLVSMSWWDENDTLLVGSVGGAGVGVFDLANAVEIEPVPLVNPNAASIHVDHERDRLVISGFLGIEVSSLDGTSVLERRISLTPEQLVVKAEADGQLFASINADGTRALVSTLDFSDRSPVIEWDLTTEPPTRIAEHPPGFTVNSFGATLSYRFAAPEPTLQVLGPNHEPIGDVVGLELERGFPVVWRSSADGSRHGPLRNGESFLDIYDAPSGERLHTLTIPGELPDEDHFLTTVYSFTNDGSRVLATFMSAERGQVWGLFNTDTGALLKSGGRDELGFPFIAGDVVYSNPPGSFDLERLDIDTFEPVGPPLVGLTLELNSLRDDPAGDLIITQAVNGTVRVWDRETGDQIGGEIVIGRQSSGINLTTAQQGRMVGVLLDTELAIWNYDIDTWPELACQLAGRNMTQLEWDDFGPQGEDYRVTCPQFPPGA